MLQPMHSRISSSRPSRILFGRNGIRDRGAGRTDQVEDAGAHLADHRVRGGEPPDTDDRLGRQTPSTRRRTRSCPLSGPNREVTESPPTTPWRSPTGREARRARRAPARCPGGSRPRRRTPRPRRSGRRPQRDRRPPPWCPRASRAAAASGSHGEPPYSSVARVLARREEVVRTRCSRARRRRRRCRTRRSRTAAPPSRCQRRRSAMSRLVMARACTGAIVSGATGRCDGPIGISRLYRLGAFMPLCASSIPANAPPSWIASAIRASAGRSARPRSAAR